ncbi:hypothetical protein [Wenzhouxiangella sp. AB-CW3]|uniref:hypothetical protein n=1 Tax=Wenzhouxiangella sp. AB-CW3 TaxID=2771012 RepID=UPI001CC2FA24|nr:hypothetical protein [Wenzhouxiangella sp. AB-CW3]
MKGRLSQWLVVLFAAGWLLFGFPLMMLWDREAALFGLPLFPLGLFIVWGVLIIALAWLMESGGRR